MFPKSAALMALASLALLAGCSRKAAAPPDAPQTRQAESGYATPPAVLKVTREGAGLRLTGRARPGAEVRLASPSGAAMSATADASGLWNLDLPPSPEGRIFGLSAMVGGRPVQAQGYILVTPQGPAAQLRAGAAALRLDPQTSPALGALDFDTTGAAIVSGIAPPSGLVFLKLDGRQIAEGRTDAAGHYAIAISQAIPRGRHVLDVSGDTFSNHATVEIAPPAPLVVGPMRLQVTLGGLRADWLTPGGGLQSTILLD